MASGQAHTRQAVAQLPGVHRHTVGHWLAIYEADGLAALLALYVPAGKPLSLPPDVLATSEPALRQPAGFASSEPLRPRVKQPPQLDIHEHTLSSTGRTQCTAKLKGPLPSHTHTP